MRFPGERALLAELSNDSYLGWCINCGDWTHDACEPDAHHYRCPECDERQVFAPYELLVRNMIDEATDEWELRSVRNLHRNR
jgi:Zn finger protein HypA/HybF involved in hydrogenase expression